MAKYFQLISFILLIACGVNVADASHIATKDSCGGATIETIVSSADDHTQPGNPFAKLECNPEGTSKQIPVSHENGHPCHLGHCSFTIVAFSSFFVPVSIEDSDTAIPHRPKSAVLNSLDRPPRA